MYYVQTPEFVLLRMTLRDAYAAAKQLGLAMVCREDCEQYVCLVWPSWMREIDAYAACALGF